MPNIINNLRLKRPFERAAFYVIKFSSNKIFRTLILRFLLLLVCVCIGTLVEFCVLHVLLQSHFPVGFTAFYFLISFFASPIQTGYSDNDRRKHILAIASLACSFGFGFSYFLDGSVSNLSAIILIIVVGCAGNLIETAWAAMGDERVKASNARSVFAISNSFMAVAALLFSAVRLYKLQFLAHLFDPHKLVIKNFSGSYLIYTLISLCVSGLICWKYQNIHDKDPINPKGEKDNFFSLIKRVFQHLKDLILSKRFRYGIFVFLLWEIAFYLTHQIGIDLKIKPFNFVTRWMAGGYIVGTLFLPFFQHFSENWLIRLGHSVSIFSLIIGLSLSTLSPIPLHIIVNTCFAVFAIGAAFLSPTLFSSVSAEVPIHKQGVLFGSYGSADTLATAIAWILGDLLRELIVNLYSKFNLDLISPVTIMFLSLLIMLLAIIFYKKFTKIENR